MSGGHYSKMLANSIEAILSAIEIYNKPNFKYREEVFTILTINAWELLLKAKILKDNKDDLNSIYALDGAGKPKINRTGSNMTVDVTNAMTKVELETPAKQNLTTLIEIRDSALHFYNDGAIEYTIYTIAAANIKNYQKLVQDWFGRSLLEYNFYILPLGFSYPFKTISLIDLEKKPETVVNLLKSVSKIKSEVDESKGFLFTCEIAAQVISAKKIITDPDITVAIDESASGSVIIQNKNLIDTYPLTYKELVGNVKKEVPHTNQTKINGLLKKIKSDTKYAEYNFRSKKHKEHFKKHGVLPTGTATIYNLDAVRYVIQELKKSELQLTESEVKAVASSSSLN